MNKKGFSLFLFFILVAGSVIAQGYCGDGVCDQVEQTNNVCPQDCQADDGTEPVPFYRLYSSNTGDHFYTSTESEKDNAINLYNYNYEGIAAYVYKTQQPGTVPFYRLYSSNLGNHFYTTIVSEKDNAVNLYNYQYEWVAAYVYQTQQPGTVPFYRLYNSNTGDHFYTTSVTEKDNAIKLYNYEYNWVAAYVLTNNAPQTCSQQGGTVCSASQTCQGSIIDTSDSSSCCSGVCEDTDSPSTGLLPGLPQQSISPDFIYSIWLGRGPYSNVELKEAFKIADNLGIKHFKVEFKWDYVEPQNDQWNWDNEGILDVEYLIELAKQYDIVINPYFNMFMPWGVIEDVDYENCHAGNKQYQAPDPEEYSEYVFETVDKLRTNRVDVGFLELDNEVSQQNDGYVSVNCNIAMTAEELKNAQNAAYDKVKAKYPDIRVSTTTFGFPGLSCLPEGVGPDCEDDKARRNSFVKVYFEDYPLPKFDFLGIHEVLGGTGLWTQEDKPAGATYEYNFGSYYDGFDFWRDILDKYGYSSKPIFNLESGAVGKEKQDIGLLQKVIFSRTQAQENDIIGWATVQLLESAFTASKPGAGETLSQGFATLTDSSLELREGYYGYYALMNTLANYPNYEGTIEGTINSLEPRIEKFSDDNGKVLYAAFIPFSSIMQSEEPKTVNIQVGIGKEVKITQSDATTSTMTSDSNGIMSLTVDEHPVFIETSGSTSGSGGLQTCSQQGGTICTSSQTCSGSWIDASDTDKCCSGTCQTSQTHHPSDSNQDGSVDIGELVDYIGEWKTGSVSISELMEAIVLWKESS